ncbi:protein artichoke-like [Lutzomyia longipalpis]|uniref:protein artichoke-like n=1 Tax=Lutzomyia longipalpis TaxID=7200 RepID=UPI00248397C3|nr:protein artichoke-like [Lutzomyia longipalpis]
MNKLLLLCLLCISFAITAVNCDLCSVCKCEKNEDFLRIFCNGTSGNRTIELDNIAWPSAKKIEAHFNHLGLTFLPKLTGDANVVGLNFDNNAITMFTPEPLQFFKNLEKISLASNQLTKIPKAFIRTSSQVKHLNLSHNSLEDIDTTVFEYFQQLRTLDLSHNQLRKISTELLASLTSVEVLNLEGNLIFDIEDLDGDSQDSDEGTRNRTLSIKELNLSKNNFAVITGKTFADFDKLEQLDVSRNKIGNVNQKAFKNMKNLRWVDLSENTIEDLHLHLPDSVEIFRARANGLRRWPLTQLPEAIKEIHVENNRLIELFTAADASSKLTFLNASDNLIEFLPDHVALPELTVLDLSFNQLTSVPQGMSIRTPALHILILDHNPIETILFVDQITVANLSLSNMPNIRALDAKALSAVRGRIPQENRTCVSISISRCPLLTDIHEQAFQGVDLCKLDLSGNNISKIPENLTDWSKLVDGIDLQDNPLDCSCSAQWMLEEILNFLYKNPEHQHYLTELRCATPGSFAGQRIVRYYRRRRAFCHPNERIMLRSSLDGPVEAGFSIHLKKGQSSVPIIIGASIFILLALVAAGFYMVREEKRRLRRNRERRLFDEIQ